MTMSSIYDDDGGIYANIRPITPKKRHADPTRVIASNLRLTLARASPSSQQADRIHFDLGRCFLFEAAHTYMPLCHEPPHRPRWWGNVWRGPSSPHGLRLAGLQSLQRTDIGRHSCVGGSSQRGCGPRSRGPSAPLRCKRTEHSRHWGCFRPLVFVLTARSVPVH